MRPSGYVEFPGQEACGGTKPSVFFLYPRGYFLAALSVKHLNMNLSRKLPITVTFSLRFFFLLLLLLPIHYGAVGQRDTAEEEAAQTPSARDISCTYPVIRTEP